MKDITIKIIGKRFGAGEEEEKLEFVTDGSMYERGDAKYYLYEESEFSGMPGCKTSLKIHGDTVRMKRIGSDAGMDNEMVFEKGKRFLTMYQTPYGNFDMEVLTRDIKSTLTEEGYGTIVLDYDISMKGLIEGKNQISIEIS